MTFLIVVPYSTVSFWYYVTLDGARLGEVHLRLQATSGHTIVCLLLVAELLLQDIVTE